MSNYTPTICGKFLCGQTVCGGEKTEQFINISAADYGENPKINLATGRMVFEEPLLSVGAETYSISISAIYNSHRSGVGLCGRGWSLSIEQQLIKSYGQYYLVSSGGDISEFTLFDEAENKYYNSVDAGQVLTVSDDGSACLSDDDGNIVNFDAEGKPISVVSGYNAAIKKIYEYDSNGRLYRIFDERLKSGNSSIKTYFLFEYAEGKLASVTAYDNYTKKRDQRQFEYDGNILVGISQTAYNSNGIKTLSKLIKSYHYNDNQLVAIVDEESLSAVKLTYDNGKISEVVSGVIDKGESISLGMGLRAGDIMAYSGLSAAAIGGEIIGGGAFVSKKSCAYSYLLQGDICYGARLTNEAGIKTIIYLDERHHIVSQFESKSESRLLTLKKETGVILKVSKDTYGSMFINGRNTVKIAGSVYNISLNNNNDPLNSLNISHYKSNENKYFDCSFWFRHFENYDRLKIKFEYLLLGESSYRSQYIWINGRANSAWQKVSATIALNRTSEGKYESKSVTDIRMTLYRAGDISVTGYEVSHLVFNPSPHVTTLVGNGSAHIAFENVGKVTISARDKTYTVTNNRTATDIYFTEGDILRSLMNKFKKQSRGEDDTCFDVVCNDGTKRLSNVKGITFSTGSQQYNLLASENPVISEMITSDGKIKVQQKYLFRAAEFAVESVNNYYENGTDGGSTANDRQTANSKTYNYHGQELSETDEYGIKTVYDYNSSGQLISKRAIGSDSSLGQATDAEYDPEGGAVSAVMSGYDYQTYGYNSPFGMLTDISNGRYNAAAGAYEQSGDKQTFEYGGYNDRVVKTSLYESGTLSGSNEITYENGRIRTVSDGFSKAKYGQRHDFVNDKVEYTCFNGDSEEIVQTDIITKTDSGKTHTSRFNGNGNAAVATYLDSYGRVTEVSEGAANAEYDYQSGMGSAVAQKVSSITDGFEGMTTQYHYDAYNNLCGWKKGDGHLEVQQIAAGTTKYTFGGNEKYFCSVGYDSNKILSPRITTTAIYRDPDEDADDDVNEITPYTQNYEYDSQGRLISKKNDYIIGTSTYSNVETISYADVGKSKADIPSQCAISMTTTVYTNSELMSSGHIYTDYSESYMYDSQGRITQISNSVDSHETMTIFVEIQSKSHINKSQTKSYGYDNLNRLISENDSIFGNRTYTYGSNGKLSKAVVSGSTRYYTYNTLNQLTSYNGNTYTYDGMGNRASRNSQAYKCAYSYTRGNLIKEVAVTLGDNVPLIGGLTVKTQYYYNCNGVRYKKVSNGETTTYYLDGEKILGEDRTDSKGNITARLRYFYDIDGLCGVRYNDATYKYVRNAYGDIVMLTSNGLPEAVYYYDAWGNCKVYDVDGNENTSSDFIGNINPFRWKGHYFDTESGLYYANGSYYDPEVGQHVDAMPVSSLIENAFNVFGLDLNGLMCDNILAYLPCVYSIFTTLELSPDPLYDPDANKSGWELFWKGVAEWFNGLSNEQKIGWGIVALLAACLVAAATSFATGGTSWAMLAAMANVFMEFAVGVIGYVALSACMALISGGDVAETISNSTADAIFLGGIFSFVSAGVSAVKVGIRSSYNAKLPGSLAVGAQPQSVTNLPGGLKDYELDPRSIALAKQGNPSWNTFRKRVWKYEAKFRAELYPGQLDRMSKGLAPRIDGASMQLHHVVGKGNDMYNVVKLTRSQHTLFHKTYGYHYNSNWNMQSLIDLFG